MSYQFYLASSSPRRNELIQLLKIPYAVINPDIDETLDPKLSLAEQCQLLSQQKAEKAKLEVIKNKKSHVGAIILAADTLVGINKQKLEKPSDIAQAKQMLKLLSGKEHLVVTGVSLLYSHDCSLWKCENFYAKTLVTFHELSNELITVYSESGEGLDKAGGYGIQGLAQSFIKKIDGTYSNVVGLPLDLIVQFLEHKISTGQHHWKELIV